VTVALVVAVLVAVVATVGLALQWRALVVCRSHAAAVDERAQTAEAALTAAQEATASAEARADASDTAHTEVVRTADEQRGALSVSEQRLTQAVAELERRTADAAQAEVVLAAATGRAETAEAAAEVERARGLELEAARIAAEQLAAEGERSLRRAHEERASLERRLGQPGVTTDSAGTPQDGAPQAPGSTGSSAVVEASWRLLLARVEQQWASSVGAGEDERGVARAHHDEQLHQAVTRELERLREEVGLHTEVTRTGTMVGVHPLLVLLAAGELAALVAPHSERVAVELGEQLVVAGEGWTPEPATGERLRASVTDTGLEGEVVTAGDSVRIAVGPHRGPQAPA